MKSMTIEQAEKLITPGGKWVMLDISIRETTAGTLSACFRTMALMRQTWMAAGELIFV